MYLDQMNSVDHFPSDTLDGMQDVEYGVEPPVVSVDGIDADTPVGGGVMEIRDTSVTPGVAFGESLRRFLGQVVTQGQSFDSQFVLLVRHGRSVRLYLVNLEGENGPEAGRVSDEDVSMIAEVTESAS